MKKLTINTATVLANIEAGIKMGEVKATIICQLAFNPFEKKDIAFDKDFVDISDITYMGAKVSDWRKFCKTQSEWGIDFDAMVKVQFEKIFTDEECLKVIKEFFEKV